MKKAKTEIVRPFNRKIDLKLKKVIENIEALQVEKKTTQKEITNTFKKAKKVGFDVKAIRQLIKLRNLSLNDRTNQQQVLETYCKAVGMPIQMSLL